MNKTLDKSHKKYIFSIGIMVLLIGITFYFVFRDNPVQSLWPYLKRMNLWFILGGLSAVFLYECCEAANIRMILKSLGTRISFGRALKYAFVGFYFSAVTPGSSGGQPMQVYYMKKDGIDISISSLTLLIIISIYQLVMLAYAVLAFCLNPALVAQHMPHMWPLFVYGILFNLLSLVILFAVIFSKEVVKKIVFFCTRLLEKMRLIKDKEGVQEKVERQIDQYHLGALHVRTHPSVLWKAFLINLTEMTAMFSVPFFAYKALGLEGASFVSVLAVQALLNISVAALPIPGSVGASESSFLILFGSIFGAQLLVPGMLVSRGMSFYFYLIVSSIVAITAYARIIRREKKRRLSKEEPASLR